MSPLIIDYNTTQGTGYRKQRPFTITPAKVQDVRRLVDIEFHAFENEQVNQILSYRDYKKATHFERSINVYAKALNAENNSNGFPRNKRHRSEFRLAKPLSNSKVSFKKIVDLETNEIVSFAKVELKAYTPEELREPNDVGHEGEPAMNRDWFGLNERVRREYMGLAEHIYIGMLATEPKHQKYGAGTMLLEDILQEADNAGVEVYLEATGTAYPLYERHGFMPIKELLFDPSQYGVKGFGKERQTVMVRGAYRDGVRKPVRSWEAAVAHAKAEVNHRR